MPDKTKPAWNTKQTVAANIVDQLTGSTVEEQTSLILKLLDQVSPEFLLALEFAYAMTPKQKRGSKQESEA